MSPSLRTDGARSGSCNSLAGSPGRRNRLPCTDITRLLARRLGFGRLRYYSAIRLPEGHLPSLLIRLVEHTRAGMTGVSCSEQEPQGLTGCFDDIMCSASGRAVVGQHDRLIRATARLERWSGSSKQSSPAGWVFSHNLPCRGERCCLPACTRPGQDPTDTKFRSSCRSPPGGYSRSIHPHYLSVYASTSHFEDVASITASRLLIDTLQHSIRSLWLRATPAGIAPACHQTISSPHVHGFVMPVSSTRYALK